MSSGVVNWTVVCLVVIPTASDAPKEAIITPPITTRVIGSVDRNCIEPNANKRRAYIPVAMSTNSVSYTHLTLPTSDLV